MSKVSPDLVGVIWYVVEDGEPKSLKAGDEIPDGVELDDDLVAKSDTSEPKPRTRRSKQD